MRPPWGLAVRTDRSLSVGREVLTDAQRTVSAVISVDKKEGILVHRSAFMATVS